MAKCDPYHTDSDESGKKNREVYHNHDDCYEGKKIEKKHRKDGTANRPRCEVCIGLG